MSRASASSLLPRLALWRAGRAHATQQQQGSGSRAPHHHHLHPSRFAPTQGAAAGATTTGLTGLLPQSLLRSLHTTPSTRHSSTLWNRLVRSSGASSDPLGSNLTVTNALIAANLATALAAASGLAPNLPSALARANWMVSPGGEWYRLLTAGFVHSGWMHLLVNTYALYALRDLERVFGGRRYLAIYLLSIVAGNWLALRQTPAYSIGCGGSSGVCGVVGAYVATRVLNRRPAPVSASTFSWVAQIVGLNLVLQALNSGGGTKMDHYGHLGGALGGMAAALLLGPRLRWATGGARGLVDAPPLPILLWRGGRVPPGW
jgi:membrane associated rhomboid family serine protease